MLAKIGFQKLQQYRRELLFCLAAATDHRSKLGLAMATLRFHLLNAMGKGQRYRAESPKRYRLCLAGESQDVWLRTTAGDLFVLYEVFLGLCYSMPKVSIGEVETIVDLGAHVGLTTLFLHRWFPHAEYICVEPNPSNLVLLRKNISPYGPKVRVVDAAVGMGSRSQAKFGVSARSWEGRAHSANGQGVTVPCWTMDQILDTYHLSKIDLLKVDIEGAERELFSDGAKWLRSVKLVMVELHGDYSVASFKADVEPLGFKVHEPGSKLGNKIVIAVASDI